MLLLPDDWVVCNARNDCYIDAPNIFAQNYEPVPEASLAADLLCDHYVSRQAERDQAPAQNGMGQPSKTPT